MNISTCLIYGFPAITVIITIVALARKAGMPSSYAPAAATGSGLIIGIIIGVTQGQGYGAGLIIGIMLAGAAVLSYDAGKAAISK